MPQSRSVAATSQGIAKIKARMAELQKPILPGKTGKSRWTQEHLAIQANVSLDTVKRFLKGTAIDTGYAIAIVNALNLKLEDIIEIQQPDPEPPQPNDINWHQICESRLDAYEERFLKNNPLTGINFYVPLGLVEPKREQEKRQKQEVNPEDGSQFYQLPETEITKTYSEPNQFFEEVLRQGNSKTKGQRLAVIGEPGAGKTTLLYQIARWILQENLGYPILIRLADVDKPIRDYLTQNWLRDATGSLTGVSPEWVAGFERLMKPLPNPPLRGEGTGKHGGTNSPRLAGEGSGERSNTPRLAGEGSGERSKQVYLLLDAVDEMGITSPLTTINQQLAEGWTQGLRVVLTCRLNVWEGEKNALRDFDVYRNLDFNSQQIQDFIEQWFNDASQSQELLKQLKEPNQTRINDLIKNPLRLALLCRTWKRGQKLPETQAGLYQRLVKGHYQWKDEQKPFQIPFDVQERLHKQLGELAASAITREQYRFRLEEKFVEQYLGKPQQENSLFDWALKLGWLNRVGLATLEEKDSDQAVYAFFHPTFQEYFAALAIQDWDYFLPRNHVNCPVEGKEYRIFQPQWKQVILLWLGRDDVEAGEKEAFIQKLVSFDDGCGEIGFYWFLAYCLAAAGINEFKGCSLSDAIVEQIVKWGFNYFNIEKQEWRQTFFLLIQEDISTVLLETIREKAIANLIQVLVTIEDEYSHGRVANILGKIAVGHEAAIQALIHVLETAKDKYTRFEIVQSLRKIAVGHEAAIQALIQVLITIEDEYSRRRVADILGEITIGHGEVIQALIQVLITIEDKYIRSTVADILGKIAVGHEAAIRELIQILITIEDRYTRSTVADILGKIGVGHGEVIQALIHILETAKDEDTRFLIADSLMKIAVGHEAAIQSLIQLLETTEDKATCGWFANILGEIAVGNEGAIQSLIQLLKTTENKVTCGWFASILGEIAVGNEGAIQSLIQLLKTTKNEYTHWKVADCLGKIAVENQLAIGELTRLLKTVEDEYTRFQIADALGRIDVGNQLAIGELTRLLTTVEGEYTRFQIADILVKNDVGNQLEIEDLFNILENTKYEDNRSKIIDILVISNIENQLTIVKLIRILETSKYKDTGWIVGKILGKVAIGNNLAIRQLIRVVETTQDLIISRTCADIVEEVAVGNELAIRELIRVVETTQDLSIGWRCADIVEEVAVGNELAIRELIRVVETTQDLSIGWRCADIVEKVAVGNELAIYELIQMLKTMKHKDKHRIISDGLEKIIKTEKQCTDVVFALKYNLIGKFRKNNFTVYQKCDRLLWKCTQNLPYSKFYQIWHHNTLTPHPKTSIYHFLKRKISELLRFTPFRSG